MDRNIGDPLNKAYEAYRNISIENENAKRQLQEKVQYKPLMHFSLFSVLTLMYITAKSKSIRTLSDLSFCLSAYVCSDRAVSPVYTAAGEKDRRPRAGDISTQSTIKFNKVCFRLVFTFIMCKLNQYIAQ